MTEGEARRRAQRVRTGLSAAVATALLIVLFGPELVQHARYAADPAILNDDARQQIWPLVRLVDERYFPGDLVATYYLDLLPVGFKLLYRGVAFAADPISFSKLLPYVLLAIVAGAGAGASWRLGGVWCAFLTAAIILGSAVYLDRMTGGLPRAFAFPMLMIIALALTTGRVWLAVVTAILGTAFYPPVAVVGGVALALWLLVLPRRSRGAAAAWPLKRRIALLAGSACTMAILHVPVLLSSAKYGAVLGQEAVAEYPELGPNGRYGPEDRPPFGNPVSHVAEAVANTVRLSSIFEPAVSPNIFTRILLWVLIGAGAAGSVAAARDDDAVRRASVLLLAGFCSALIAMPLHPHLHLPSRYGMMTGAIVAAILLPAGWIHLVRRLRCREWCVAVAAAGVVTAAILLPSNSVARAGWTLRVPAADQPLYGFIASLPRDAMIAGWPGARMPIDSVAYLTLRPAFVTYETHQVFSERYAAEMRRRMRALVAAYVIGDAGATSQLYREWGVTHLIISKEHLAGVRPRYFEPFDTWIGAAGPSGALERLASLRDAVVYADDRWIVVDLRRLRG